MRSDLLPVEAGVAVAQGGEGALHTSVVGEGQQGVGVADRRHRTQTRLPPLGVPGDEGEGGTESGGEGERRERERERETQIEGEGEKERKKDYIFVEVNHIGIKLHRSSQVCPNPRIQDRTRVPYGTGSRTGPGSRTEQDPGLNVRN